VAAGRQVLELARSIRQAVGFRNVLAHEYTRVNDDIVPNGPRPWATSRTSAARRQPSSPAPEPTHHVDALTGKIAHISEYERTNAIQKR
jgi:hypothetical protein